MLSSLPWRRGAALLLAMALSSASVVQTAPGTSDGASPADGAIEIPYGDPGEIRPGEGWVIDCGSLGSLDGVTLACDPESITLTADAYDPKWGERALPVSLRSQNARMDVTYAVRMAPPPAPELGVGRFDMPVAVGEQAMIPLAALGIVCSVCSASGGATIEIGTLPPGVDAGVDETHISIRATAPGDVVVPLLITDDAGQEVSSELTVSFVPTLPRRPGALHVIASGSEWDLSELFWGKDPLVVCGEPRPKALECTPDGTARLPADTAGPAQFMFRVVDGDGATAWGSVTVDEKAKDTVPAAPSWRQKAPLRMVSQPAEDEPSPTGESLLGPLSSLLEGMSGT